MKKIIGIWVLFCIAFSVKAQQVRLGFGPELLVPAGNSSNISSIGGGLAARAEVQVSGQFGLTGQIAYNHFIGRKYLGLRSDNLKYIPVKLGLKYYTDPKFYLEGNVGANLPQNNTEATSLAWSIGFGSQLGGRNADQFLDMGMRYEGWTKDKLMNVNGKYVTFGFIAFRLTYNFNL
ncbi:MAG: hypothetical protein EOO99_06825 [Pedobacter sp.]|nr:MAG: hypothetical protein EOO99_06825 [Pedobacter sp.]